MQPDMIQRLSLMVYSFESGQHQSRQLDKSFGNVALRSVIARSNMQLVQSEVRLQDADVMVA